MYDTRSIRSQASHIVQNTGKIPVTTTALATIRIGLILERATAPEDFSQV